MQKRSVQLPEYYDFILLDVQMPVVDGRTAARTIRAMNRPDAKTVLMFALSADAFVEDERLSAESGLCKAGGFCRIAAQHWQVFAPAPRVSERAKVYRKHRKSSWFLQRQKQFCVCGICVIFVVLSCTVKWEC